MRTMGSPPGSPVPARRPASRANVPRGVGRAKRHRPPGEGGAGDVEPRERVAATPRRGRPLLFPTRLDGTLETLMLQ